MQTEETTKVEEQVFNAEETVNQETPLSEEAKETLSEQQQVVFDPAAFAKADITNTPVVDDEKKEEVNQEEDGFAWDQLNLSDEEEKKEIVDEGEKVVDEEKKVVDEEKKEEVNTYEETYKENFKKFTEELGIEAESIEEIKTALDKLVEENKMLRETSGVVTNETIQQFEKFIKLDDEKIVRRNLELQGLNEKDINTIIDKYRDTDLLDVEATKVRAQVQKAIEQEKSLIVKSKAEESSKSEKMRQDSVQEFTKYVQSTDTMFNFKMTNNPENLAKVQNDHIKYVTTGEYLNDITSSTKNLSESAWLWKNRDVLMKAFINNGRQKGRAEVLNNLSNPSQPNVQRFTQPGQTELFDAKKFMQG